VQTLPLHTWSVPHEVPSALVAHAVVLVAGWQAWHGFVGLAAPDAKDAPPMKQPTLQLPSLHTACAAQLVPSAMLLHPVVLIGGWQLLQLFSGLMAPGAKTAAPMKQPILQLPSLHTASGAQLVPSALVDHDVVLVAGWQLLQ
jgi:hypothetical protein